MKYVNPELFMNFDNIKDNSTVNGEFVWLLLASDDAVGDIIKADDSKNLTILKKSVVGFATAGTDAIAIEKTEPGRISLTISGSSNGNILYTVGSEADDNGFPAKALALVKTICTFGNNGTDAIIQHFKEKGYYSYTNPPADEQNGDFVPEYITGVSENDILQNIIVIAAYDVSGNKTAINNYNFSGFTVSNSNVEISGLYI